MLERGVHCSEDKWRPDDCGDLDDVFCLDARVPVLPLPEGVWHEHPSSREDASAYHPENSEVTWDHACVLGLTLAESAICPECQAEIAIGEQLDECCRRQGRAIRRRPGRFAADVRRSRCLDELHTALETNALYALKHGLKP